QARKIGAMTRTFLAAAAVWAMWAPGFDAQTSSAPARAEKSDVKADVNYEQHVRPILATRCFGCHGPRQQQSGLRLDLRQNALRGGDYGVVIVPGSAAESKLIQRLMGSDAG